MKKICTLFCIIVVMLSANAAPKAGVKSHFIPLSQKLLQEKQLTDYDTVNVAIIAYSATYIEEYVPEENACYCHVYATDNNFYSFRLGQIQTTGPENGKTYTWSDNLFPYTNDGDTLLESGTDGTFTKTETETSLSIEGKIVTREGHVYLISYYWDKTQEVKDSHDIILEPVMGTTKQYRRKVIPLTSCFRVGERACVDIQASDAIMVECKDGTVYWKDPISHYRKDSWIKGKKEGSTITFPAKQPVFASANYLYTVRWGVQTGTKFALADDYSEDIILDIVNDSLILRGSIAMDLEDDSKHYLIGIFREKFSKLGTYSFYAYGDSQTTLYIPSRWPDLNLIMPPVGMVKEKLPYTAHDDTGYNEDVKDSVSVGWDADTVYIQGLCPNLPNGWVKGTLQEGIVTFKTPQYIGQRYLSDMWMFGGDINEKATDYHLKYDVESNYFVGIADEDLIENATDEWVIFNISAYNNITIGTLTPTSIKELTNVQNAGLTPVCKYIHNGQLLIERNGKRYGAVGF